MITRLGFASALLVLLGSSFNLEALTITVTNSADSGAGSLRQAIADAVNGDEINFDQSLDGGTITLTSGTLVIAGLEVTISAASLSQGITLNGNDSERVFTIYSSSNVALESLTIENGREDGVTGNGSGGGVFASGGLLSMTNCSIRNCYAEDVGGGLCLVNVVGATLDRCRIVGNNGINFGGGIYFVGTSAATVSNTAIAGNSSTNGGGICNLTDSPTLINCSIQGNLGAGIRNEFSSSPILRNTILWGNRIGNGSGAIAPQQIKNQTSSSPGPNPNVDYCLVEGASGSGSFNDGNKVNWGANNLNGTLVSNNPDFVSPVLASSAPNSAVDLRFLTGSPVIDEGDNSVAPVGTDLAGQLRIQNGTVDLGAYEAGYTTFAHLYPSLLPNGDDNDNGRANFLDYALGLDPSIQGTPDGLPSFSTSNGDSFMILTQRSNALDATPDWVTSITIGNWESMIEGVHYIIDSTSPISSEREQITLKLLESDPRRFYRQGFSQAE